MASGFFLGSISEKDTDLYHKLSGDTKLSQQKSAEAIVALRLSVRRAELRVKTLMELLLTVRLGVAGAISGMEWSHWGDTARKARDN